MSILTILPVLGFLLLWALFLFRRWDWRVALMAAATVFGVLVVAGTELLSLPHWITPAGIRLFWTAIDLFLGGWLFLQRRTHKVNVNFHISFSTLSNACSRSESIFAAGILVFLTITGIVALVNPPNTYDAMVYHLPRIIHWIQNQSVAPFATHELKELHMPPAAEYLMLHIQLLWGSDRLVNLVQWAALLGCLVGVSLLARILGASPFGQWLAAAVCVSIPQGIIQASGPKNDYVLALWLTGMAVFAWRYRENPDWANSLGVAASLGLAWMTKGTGYVYGAALLTILFLAWPGRVKRAWLKHLPLMALTVLLLNLGHFTRNYSLHGSPFGPKAESPTGEFKYTNDRNTTRTASSNVVRNIGIHMSTPDERVNRFLETTLIRTLRKFGIDPEDPANTWTGTTFHISSMSKHEDLAGNGLHLAFSAAVLGFILAFRRFRSRRPILLHAVSVLAAFLLFCAVLKWQPWNARLHLPLFVLFAPAIGVVFDDRPFRPFGVLAVMLLFLTCGPLLYENDLRPAGKPANFNRADAYFASYPQQRQAYEELISFVKRQNPKKVGLDTDYQRFEYPLSALLGAGEAKIDLRHVGVTNQSVQFDRKLSPFEPDIIICTKCGEARRKWNKYAIEGRVGVVFGDSAVFGKNFKLQQGEHSYSSFSDRARELTVRYLKQVERHQDGWAGPILEETVIANSPATTLLIGGDAFLKNMPEPLLLSISMDNQRIGEQRITVGSPDPFRLRIPVKAQAGPHKVEIRANTWMVPDTVYRNGDLRPLSYRLQELSLEGEDSLCSYSYSKAWYDEEKDGTDRWRWSSGTTRIEVRTTRKIHVDLAGMVWSLHEQNLVTLQLGNKVIATFGMRNSATTSLAGTSAVLEPGLNVFQFSSRQPATQVPNDNRQLAFALRNFRVTAKPESIDCKCTSLGNQIGRN